MFQKSCLLGSLVLIACAPDRIVETVSTPRLKQERLALSDSEYVAACEHRPGARMRLYGCKPRGPQRIPLLIVDGRALPTDTIGPGKLHRERVMSALNGNQIESVEVVKADDSTARNVYGDAARFGVIKITLLPAFRKSSSG